MKPRKFTVSPKSVTAAEDSHNSAHDALGDAILGLIDIFTSGVESSADNISFVNNNLPIIKQYVDVLEEFAQSGTSGNAHIQSFMCPKCHNKTVYDADRDVYSLRDIWRGDLFVCDECGSEFEGSLSFDNTVDLQPIEEDE